MIKNNIFSVAVFFITQTFAFAAPVNSQWYIQSSSGSCASSYSDACLSPTPHIGDTVPDLVFGSPNGGVVVIPTTTPPILPKPCPYAPPTVAPSSQLSFSTGGLSSIQASVCSGGNTNPSYPTADETCHVMVCAYGQTFQMGYCSTYVDSSTSLVSGTTYTCSGHVNATCIGSSATSSYPLNQTISGQLVGFTCPTGYILSGSNCNLSDACAVTPDSSISLNHNPDNTFSLSNPADIDTPAIVVDPVYTAPDNAQFVGTDANGNWQYIDVQATTSGGSLVITHSTVTDSSGNTGVQVNTVNIDSSGVVNSVSQSQSGGSISISNSGGSTTGSSTAAPAGSSFGGGGGGGSPVVFPSDYARTGEAASAAASINANLDGHLNNSETVGDPANLTGADAPTFGTALDGLKSFAVPVHTSGCPQPSMDLSMVLGAGHVYTMTAHCQLVQDHFATLRAAMLVCWSIAALFVVLRA